MTAQSQKIGQIGEELALKHLLTSRNLLITSNFHSRYGEIDLILLEENFSENNCLIFVEVKTRTNKKYGSPEEAFTPSKKRKILKTIYEFINQNPRYENMPWRLDLITINLSNMLRLEDIKHYKNLFNE